MSNKKNKPQSQQNQNKPSRKWTDYAYDYVVDPVQAKSLGLTQLQIEEARRTGGAYPQTHERYGRVDLIRFGQLNTPSWVQPQIEWDLIRPSVGQPNKLGGLNPYWTKQLKANAEIFAHFEAILEAEGMPADLPYVGEQEARVGFKTSRILAQLRTHLEKIDMGTLRRASRKLLLNLARVEIDWLEEAPMPELVRGLGYTSSRGLQKAIDVVIADIEKSQSNQGVTHSSSKLILND
jgi:hypothetical protein